MKIIWDERHGKILSSFLIKLTDNGLKWFIIRGYEGLPDKNPSKDVDIMVEPGREKKASELLIDTFKEFNLNYLHNDQFGHIHCYIGIDTFQKFSVHIDLIEGYISKGFEVFTFCELYQHVVDYNELKVLDDLMNGIMLVVYKIFGYHKAKLKPAYQKDILKAWHQSPAEFKKIMIKICGKKTGEKMCGYIANNNFEKVVAMEPEFTKALKHYTRRERPLKTFKYSLEFLGQKVNRIVFNYKKYAKTFAVMAPDGTGKTTFLDTLIDMLEYYYVNDKSDNRFHVYHFRPGILPNLGAVGEKAGVMKQDTNFTDPHRSKPAGGFSSFLRISYYTLDYIIGWKKCIRNDVHYDRYTVFDRYSYDFIVDPQRTKLKLPDGIRKFFVKLTPQPQIVFFLEASPEIIYSRKQELTLEEIERQTLQYKLLAESNKSRFVIINAEQTPEKMASDALEIILERYAKYK